MGSLLPFAMTVNDSRGVAAASRTAAHCPSVLLASPAPGPLRDRLGHLCRQVHLRVRAYSRVGRPADGPGRLGRIRRHRPAHPHALRPRAQDPALVGVRRSRPPPRTRGTKSAASAPQAAKAPDAGTLTGVADAEWNVERHLLGKPPEVVALYHHFAGLVSACGPFTYSVSKSAITFKGARRGFAGARLRQRALVGYLDLQRRVDDPRITSSSPYTSRLYVHQFRIETASQLDDEFAGWIREAYQVGAGAHLSGTGTPAIRP
jgi:uncharacterized protein DUF5655